MKEAWKSMARRLREDAETKTDFWRSIFGLNRTPQEVREHPVLDIGSGDAPINVPGVVTFDKGDGDANLIDDYFSPNKFWCVHASHVLEHLWDPADAVKRILRILLPGGHLVATVPSWEIYEGCIWPSRFNTDHKTSWSLWRRTAPHGRAHIYVPDFLKQFDAEVLLCRLVDTNYSYIIGAAIDQTFDPSAGVEAAIEFVLRKPRP